MDHQVIQPDAPSTFTRTAWFVSFGPKWRQLSHPIPLPEARRCHPDGLVCLLVTGGREVAANSARELFDLNWNALHTTAEAAALHPLLGTLATYDGDNQCWLGRGL
jgi:hypothetical protein